MQNKMTRKRFLQLIFLLLLLIAGRALILFLIEPVDYSIYFNRILKNKAAANDGHVDMVFVGASRTLRTFDPAVFEETLGLNCVFNAASGLQPIESGYFMLKEIIDRYHPEYAVLGVSWDGLQYSDSTLAKVIVLDRLTGKNKLDYFLAVFHPHEYLNALSLCYRFRNHFDPEEIRNTVREKIELEKTGYTQRLAMPDLYTDSGFIYSYLVGDIPNYADISYEPEKNDPAKAGFLEKIAELCAQNGVRLFMVSAPTSVMNLYRISRYQEAVDHYTDFAAAHGIDYVNLNYLRGREEWLGDQLMFDFNHVNGEGAELVSKKYADHLKALMNDEDPPDLFYADLDELKQDVRRIIAVGADISVVDLKATVQLSSRQTGGISPKYRIQISQDDETYTPLTGWTDETSFVFDVSAYKDTIHFLIEAMSPTGEPGCAVTYHIPV